MLYLISLSAKKSPNAQKIILLLYRSLNVLGLLLVKVVDEFIDFRDHIEQAIRATTDDNTQSIYSPKSIQFVYHAHTTDTQDTQTHITFHSPCILRLQCFSCVAHRLCGRVQQLLLNFSVYGAAQHFAKAILWVGVVVVVVVARRTARLRRQSALDALLWHRRERKQVQLKFNWFENYTENNNNLLNKK